MTEETSFSDRLSLALKALNISPAQLSALVGIDKSVVSRWISGKTQPSRYNMSRVSTALSQFRPGFSGLHWDMPHPEFIAFLSPASAPVLREAAPVPVKKAGALTDFLPFFSSRAGNGLVQGLDRFSGIWAQFYAPMAPAGFRPIFCGGVKIGQQGGHLRYDVSDGPRGVWTGGGPAFCVDGKLWVMIEEHKGRSDLCTMVYEGTSGHKAMIVDGLALARAANAGGVPVCGRFTLVRLADLSEDQDRDSRRFTAICERAGELSLSNLNAQMPDWLNDLLLGDSSGWGNRHQAFILPLTEADNLTTDAIDIDMLRAAGRPRREILDVVRGLFRDTLDA